MNFKKTLQASVPKMIGNPFKMSTAMVSFALSVVKGKKTKKATKGKKKTTVRKSKIMSKKQKQQMEMMERICQSAYGIYIRGATTVAARYIGHPAVAIPASEMVKTMMEEAALPVNRPFVTITKEQMSSLKIEERKGEKEYIKTKDKREERERLPFSQPIRDMGLLWNRMWGYEDDAPVAGQPFYDIVELYGDLKRAANDFSDYLENGINDWAKGLDEDYKNRELAKPASMRSDFGDAITGLTSGKEDNLSFGGKAGAFFRGLVVDGCGKLLIKDTLLAASSPCDTAKSVMATVKAVGDMDEEDFSRIAKEIKTTWDEASEEEKLNYSGQAGAIIADFLIAKKLKLPKQANVGVKVGSKADDIAEAGVKASSKVDDIARAGTKAGSKADDIAEAGAKAGSKADDIAGTGVKAGSKADDVAEAGAKISSKADDTAKAAGQTTVKTVVKEDSATNGSGVKISGEKPKTDVDRVKPTGVEDNSLEESVTQTDDVLAQTEMKSNIDNATKYELTDRLKLHIEMVDPSVPRKRGIGGAHKRDVFIQNDIKIISETPHPNIDGVSKIEYQMPKRDKTGVPISGEYQDGVPKVKTVYDSNIISTDEYLRRGLEAANNAASQYENGILPREWVSVDNNGVSWRGYCKNGEITSMYPE